MAGFRRAQLRGSEELFRPTQPDLLGTDAGRIKPADVDPVPSSPSPSAPSGNGGAHSQEGRLVRLSDDDIAVLADAVQKLKFPQKVGTRPSVDEYERLEALRQKLLDS
jgi:hypothetical protein